MPILLNDEEIRALRFSVPDGYTAEDILLLYARGIAKAQLKHIYELLKEDTADWCFGVSEELRAELKKEAGL